MTAIRTIDPKGRVILPVKIRKQLNLQPGLLVEIEAMDDGTIKVRPAKRGEAEDNGNTSENA